MQHLSRAKAVDQLSESGLGGVGPSGRLRFRKGQGEHRDDPDPDLMVKLSA